MTISCALCVGLQVPHQYNLWMGNSAQGSSSGLHHDFHDNLYVLLRGKKRFVLYPPHEAHNLYTEGTVVKVEGILSNGLLLSYLSS